MIYTQEVDNYLGLPETNGFDLAQKFDLLKVHHGVLLYYPDEQDENADITITTKKAGILAIAACNEDGISKLIESVEGDQELYKAFCESMTPLSLYFNIIEP